MAGVVAGRVRNGGHALLGHGWKPVRRPGRQHRVDRGLGRPVGGVLEPDRHRQPRRELTMHLALRGARADRHPGGQVGDVLRDLRIEKLGGRRQPHIVDVEEQLAGEPQPLVDVERLVEIGVIDEPLPPDRGARLLEVAAHQHDELARVAVGQLLQLFRIIQCGPGIVDGTRSRNNDEPGIASGQRLDDRGAGIGNHVRRTFADRDLFQQDGWRNERPYLSDPKVVGPLKHPIKITARRGQDGSPLTLNRWKSRDILRESVRRATRDGVKKRLERPVPTPGTLKKYGRGREVHAWQTLPGAVDKTLPLPEQSKRLPYRPAVAMTAISL